MGQDTSLSRLVSSGRYGALIEKDLVINYLRQRRGTAYLPWRGQFRTKLVMSTIV
jgi:hypothetical protein